MGQHSNSQGKASAWLALVVAAALVITGCSSKKSPSVVRTTSTSAATSASTAGSSSSAPSSSSASSPSTSGSKAAPTIAISPSTGLKSGQTVQVTGSGFSPHEALVINECADKGTNTGPGDCNLSALRPTLSDAQGKISAQFTVSTGPFGANNIVCSASQACLLSVSQATPSPTEEADVKLQFG